MKTNYFKTKIYLIGLLLISVSTNIWSQDTEAPRVQSIGRHNPSVSPTSADMITFGVTFTEAVNNVSKDDFLIGGGTSATITDITDFGNSLYGLTISGGDLADFNGNVFLGFRNSQNIEDLSGNPLTNTNVIDQPAINSFTIDNGAPQVMITSTENSTTGANPIPITITFSEEVTGFNMGDLSVSNCTASNFSGFKDTYTLDILPTSNGAITINVNSSAAIDAAGNGNIAPPEFSIIYDQTLAIKDLSISNDILIHPNPGNEIIVISGDSNLQLQYAELFDIRGKLIYTKELNSDITANTIDISTINSGSYILKLSSENSTALKKIVKM